MRGKSLRIRLVIAASLLIGLAVALAGAGLFVIFDRILDDRTAEDLDRQAKRIVGQLGLGPDGAPRLAVEPNATRFEIPYGGRYWQVEGPDRRMLRSRSLWDTALTHLPAVLPEAGRGFELEGPERQRLIAVARPVGLAQGGGEVALTVVVAMDRRDLAESRAAYLRLLVPSLAALGIVLAAAMWVFVQRALAPFRTLQADLRAIHDGRRPTLPAGFPDEVQPLVDDLNRLIGVQERALHRARVQAGDMAHGLKTPLAVLGALSRRIAEERPDLAGEIDEQALAMRGQVERSLARARVAAAGRLRRVSSPVLPVVERLVATLRRLPEGEAIRWEVAVPPDLAYPCEAGDLTEMLGNLLDNARKWAHRRVVVAAFPALDGHRLRIEDDGAGMSEEAMSRIGRGRRWDESTPGTGFGMAIAFDIAEETGGALALARSDLGGLRVELAWPNLPRSTA